MQYNPNIHHRYSIRLKDYDYSQEGLYFLTICTQNRLCLFGDIVEGEMILNELGDIANDEWYKLQNRFPNVLCDMFQIMPNHIHGIIVIDKPTKPINVGATFTIAPNMISQNINTRDLIDDISIDNGAIVKVAPTLGNIVRAYKSLVVKGCLEIYKNKNELLGKLWQRNYYEHIIRNYKSYNSIANYIEENPLNWKMDEFFQ